MQRRIGYADRTENAAALARMGYDYLEARLTEFDLGTPDGTRAGAAALGRIAAEIIAIDVLQSFIPQGLFIAGPRRSSEDALRTYFARAAEVADAAGAGSAVFGAAWSRNLPDGYDRDRARAELLEAYHWCADAFAGSGCVVGIEPQNIKECNFVRLVSEATSLAREVGRPEIGVAVDFYHIDEEGESLDDVVDAGALICAVQTADTGRNEPGTGQYPHRAFVRALDAAGYRGPVSVEIMHDIPDVQKAASLAFLRELFA
ncbi:TIM barrel protein [Nigerium sp.]|uniref:sugar phosphate isomerase/epimerase family protein n=1 Tax=Nigerium sp. TaxID=2042655 RepID=UPI0032221692